MHEKSILSNLEPASKHFGIGLVINGFSGLLMIIGGFFSLFALIGFLSSLVFMGKGFIKLFGQNLLPASEEGLDTSFARSNFQAVISKVFTGTFWLSLWVGLLALALLFNLSQGENLFEAVVSVLLLKGIPPEKMGLLMVVIFWSYFLGTALFSSTLFFAITLANTLKSQRSRVAKKVLIIILTLAATGSIPYVINKQLNLYLDMDTFSNALELSLLGLAFTAALLVLFIILSERLLTKKYNHKESPLQN